MNTFEPFRELFTTSSTEVSVFGFVVNLILAALLAVALGQVYVRFGRSLSNRRVFAANFVALTMTTMFIITVVKSSLALSLGLVGALSIVRFRAAIKEPEELAFLFLAIAIGLGLGADQRVLTLAAFALIALAIALRGRARKASDGENLLLTVSSDAPDKVSLDQIVGVLKDHCRAVKMKRLDESGHVLEASFLVEFDDFESLQSTSRRMRELSDSLTVTFLDNRGLA